MTIAHQISKAIREHGRFLIDRPKAILMHPDSYYKLFSEFDYLFNTPFNPNCPAGAEFYGIPIYRTYDVETFKIL